MQVEQVSAEPGILEFYGGIWVIRVAFSKSINYDLYIERSGAAIV